MPAIYVFRHYLLAVILPVPAHVEMIKEPRMAITIEETGRLYIPVALDPRLELSGIGKFHRPLRIAAEAVLRVLRTQYENLVFPPAEMGCEERRIRLLELGPPDSDEDLKTIVHVYWNGGANYDSWIGPPPDP